MNTFFFKSLRQRVSRRPIYFLKKSLVFILFFLSPHDSKSIKNHYKLFWYLNLTKKLINDLVYQTFYDFKVSTKLKQFK